MSLVLRQFRSMLLLLVVSMGLFAGEGTGTGLLATYYANETLSGSPVVSRTDAQVNFSWAGGAAATGMPVDSFSARWDGEIEALYSEPLTVIARTDDGVRLWINGSLVIDAWVLRGASDSTYTFTAVAGQRYRIRMEYYEHFGSAVAQLEWQSGTLTRAAIPTAQLYPVVPTQAPVGSGTGLLARYFANETLSDAPVVSRTDATVDFSWGGGSPDALVPVDGFSARWDGEIEARYSAPLTITARTDDGVRVWLNGILVVDAWVLRSAANSSFTFSAEAGQRYRIRMEYFEHTGSAVARLWWQSASEFQGPIPTSQLYPTPANDPPVGTGTGLLARFYANETLSGAPVLTRTDARVDFAWGGGSPGSGVPADVFSARWDGEIEPRATEALTLVLRTDDGVRLWLNDELVINEWILRGAADSTYTFNAQAGQRYRIRIDYFEHYGSAVAKFWWQSPSEPKGPVPTSQLYPTAPVEPPLGTGTGLTGSYFTNETLTGTPTLVRLDPVVDFDWAGGSPASSIPVDLFSVRWEGEFEPRYSEALTLIARTDDGVRVWIDDQPVISAWILRGAADSTYTFSAQAGQRYRIRMETYEHFGAAVAKLWWQSAHELRGPIPTTQLYPAAMVETSVVGFAAATSAVSEKSGSTTIAVTLSSASTTTVTATLSVIGSGIQIPASLTIPAGETTANIPVTIQDDPRYGPDRQVTIALSNPAGAVLGQTTHVLTLQNTESKPTIGFTTDNSFNLEQSGTASVVVRLSAVSAVATTVSVVTSGTATTGTDYTAPAATLQIPADTFEGTIFIPLLADADPEANETIVLTLANPVDATLGGITAHTLTLSDGNLAPVIVSGPTPAVNPVTGTSVELTLVANDDGVPAALTTTWSVVGTPPATVTFTPSSSTGFSAASVATFNAPGTYTIQAQVRDAYNATDTEQVIVTVVAPRQPQTITFAAPPAKTYGDAAFTLTATASSGLPVTLTSADPSIATISGSTVSIVGAGSTTITAAQAGDAAWEPATPVTHPLTVAKASQTITFAALTARVVGDVPFTLTATASSGQPVSYISYNTSVATVSGSTVTIVAAGSTTITASQAGTANYLAAASVDQVLTLTKQTQTITFAALAGKTYGDAAFTLSATASSSLPMTYTSADPAVATVSGNTVTIVGAGSTSITAAQAGDATWEAATPVVQSLTVAKASQTITFAALTARAVGDAPFTLGASASSGLTITYISSDTNVATVSGNTVTIVGAGTTTLTASQGGNANYLAASVQQVQTINAAAKQPQTITFAALPAKTYGDAPFPITPTASSGLPVALVSSDTSVATISEGTVTIHAAGMTIITATQSGDTTWDAAASVPRTLTVSKAPQTISFAALSSRTVGDLPFSLTATASSGLPVTFTSSTPAVASVSSDMVTINAAGTTTITANQAGNGNYLAAAPVPQPLTISAPAKQTQTITFGALSGKITIDAPFALNATASSGLPVSYISSNQSVATISEGTVTIVGAGTTTITANQPGDDTFADATPVPQNLVVNKSPQTITFAPLADKVYTDEPFELTATASSGLPVSYWLPYVFPWDPQVATIDGSTVTLIAGGTVTIAAYQPGNAIWLAAASVEQELQVGWYAKEPQTITFATVPPKTYGNAPFTLIASATSSGPIVFTSSDPSVLSITGSTGTILSAGPVTITANQAGSLYYLPAPPVEQNIVIAQASQTVTFAPLATRTINGAPFILNATASSALPIVYTSSNPEIASVSGAEVTLHAVGSTTITAAQAGSVNWLPASTARSLVVAASNNAPTITAISNRSTNEDVSTTAISFTVADTETAVGSLIMTGTSSNTALVDASNMVFSGTTGSRSLVITPKAHQHGVATISVTVADDWVPAQTATATFTLTVNSVPDAPTLTTVAPLQGGKPTDPVVITYGALASAANEFDGDGDVVNFRIESVASGSLGVRLAGSTATPTPIVPTTTILDATKELVWTPPSNPPGQPSAFRIRAFDGALLSSSIVTVPVRFLLVNTISFSPVTTRPFGLGPFPLFATATSGLDVTYSSSNPLVATVSGSQVTIVGAGTTVITANQSGNSMYDVAIPVDRPFEVVRAEQQITFPYLADKAFGDLPFTPNAVTSSGLDVVYSSSDESVATVSGSTVTITGIGTTTVTASSDGGQNYVPAQASRPLTVKSVHANTPTFSPPSGSYFAPLTISVSSIPEGAEVWYTTAEFTPADPVPGAPGAVLYEQPIQLTSNQSIKAVFRSIVDGVVQISPVSLFSYTLNNANQFAIHSPQGPTSITSPGFIEISGPTENMSITAVVTVSGETMSTAPVHAVGENKAYVDVSLSPDETNEIKITATDQAGNSHTMSQLLTWTAIDVSSGMGQVVLRAGDSVQLIAQSATGTVVINPGNLPPGATGVSVNQGGTLRATYSNPGHYEASVWDNGVMLGSRSIIVVGLIFPPNELIAAEVDATRTYSVQLQPEDSGSHVRFSAADTSVLQVGWSTTYGQAQLTLKPLKRGKPIVVARVGSLQGPIISHKEVTEFEFELVYMFLTSLNEMLSPEGKGVGYHLAMRPHIPGLTNEDTTIWSPQVTYDELSGESVAIYSDSLMTGSADVPDPIAVNHPHLTQQQAALSGSPIPKVRVTQTGSITRNFYRLAVSIGVDSAGDHQVGDRQDGNGDGIRDLDIPAIPVSMTLTPPNDVIGQRLTLWRPRESQDFSSDNAGTIPWLYGSTALGRVSGVPHSMPPGGSVISHSGSPSVSSNFEYLPISWSFSYWNGKLWNAFYTGYTLEYTPPGDTTLPVSLSVRSGLSYMSLPGGTSQQPPEMTVAVGSSGFAEVTYTYTGGNPHPPTVTKRHLPGNYTIQGPPKPNNDPNDKRVTDGTLHVTGASISLTPSRFGIQTGYIFDLTNDFWYQGDYLGVPQFLAFDEWYESTVNGGSYHIPLYITAADGNTDNVFVTLARNNLTCNLQAYGQELFATGQSLVTVQASQLEPLIKYDDNGNIDPKKYYKVHGISYGKNAECTFSFLANGQITAQLRYVSLTYPSGIPSPLATDTIDIGNNVALLAGKRLYVDIPVKTYATPTLNPDLLIRYNVNDAFDRGFGPGWQTNYDMRVMASVGPGAIYDYTYYYHHTNSPSHLIDEDGYVVTFNETLEIPAGNGISARSGTTVSTRGRYILDIRYGKTLKPVGDWRADERWRLTKDNNLRYYFNTDGWLVRISTLTGAENIEIERGSNSRATSIKDSYGRTLNPQTLIGSGSFATPLASVDAPHGGKWNFAYTDNSLGAMTLQSTGRTQHGTFALEDGGNSRTWTFTNTSDGLAVSYGDTNGQERKLVWDKDVNDRPRITYPMGGSEIFTSENGVSVRIDQVGIKHYYKASNSQTHEFWVSDTATSGVKFNRVEVLLDNHLMITGSRRYLTANEYHQSDAVWGPLKNQQGLQIEGSRVLLSRTERGVSGLEDSPTDDLVTTYDYYTEGKDLASLKVQRSPTSVSRTYARSEGRLTSVTDERQKTWTVSTYAGYNQPKRMSTPGNRTLESTPDEAGLITGSKDLWEYSSSYDRDVMGRTITEHLPGGASTETDYDPLGMVTRQKDQLGRESHFFYDRLGRLVRQKHTPAASEVASSPALPDDIITYESGPQDSQLVTRKRGNLVLSSVRYDALGRIADSIDLRTLVAASPEATAAPGPTECTTHYTYDPISGFLDKITDARGHDVKFTYDNGGRLLTQRSPEGNLTTNTYNTLGWLLSVTDGNGGKTSFTYDRIGQVRRTINPAGGWTLAGFNESGSAASVTASQGKGTSTAFDDDGLPNRIRDPFGNALSITFNKQGSELIQTIKRVGDTAERRSIFDARRLPDGTKTLINGGEFVNNLDVRADGSMRKVTPAGLGPVDRFVDGYGRGAKTTMQMKVDGVETPVHTVAEYDPLSGLPISGKSVMGFLRKSQPHPTTGERNGRESNALAPDQSPSTLTTEEVVLKRDANGNILESGRFKGGEQTGIPSLLTYRTYDEDNRLKTLRGPDQVLMEWFYDDGGRVHYIQRAGLETARYEYDALNNVVKVTEPGNRVTSSTYDTMGLTMSRTVGGLTTTYEYDPRTRFLIRINEPGGKVTERIPDAKGRLASVRILPQAATRFEYDDLDRLILTTFPDNKTEQRTYVADRQDLDVVTDRLERTITHHYDRSGLLTEKEINDHGTIARVKVQRSLPAAGGMVQSSRVEQAGVDGDPVTRRMDRSGRIVSLELPGADPLVSSFDLAGRLATKGDQTFGYNIHGQLDVLQQAGVGQAQFLYDQQGRVQSEILPNGLTRSYVYNAIGNLNRLTQTIDNIAEEWILSRDQQGRITRVDGPGYVLGYGYDELGRLQREVRTGDLPGATYYAYDSAGNRTWSVQYDSPAEQAQSFTGTLLPTQVLPQTGTWIIAGEKLSAASNGATPALANVSLSATVGGDPGTCSPEFSVAVQPAAPTNGGESSFAGIQLVGTNGIVYRAEWMMTRPAIPGSFDLPQPVGGLVIRRVDGESTSVLAASETWPTTGTQQSLTVIVWPDERLTVSTNTPSGMVSMTSYCPGIGTDPGNTIPSLALVGSATGANGASLASSAVFDDLTWNIAQSQLRSNFIYNQFNQLMAQTETGSQAAQIQYAYDDLGRLTTRERTGTSPASVAYEYDVMDRLARATINGSVEDYSYFADSWMRRSATTATQSRFWTYDGTNVLTATTGVGQYASTTKFLYKGNAPLWESNVSQGLRVYARDPLGNVAGLVGPLSNGTVTRNGYQSAFTYNAFGSIIREQMGQLDQNSIPERVGVTAPLISGLRGKGMWYDAALSQYKTQTRYYAPDAGRFTQVDPARAGSNWYAYCDGDPVNREDPSGLKWVLRVSPNGNDEVVWKDEDGDLAPKERYEVDQGYLARIRGGGRSNPFNVFTMEEPPLHAARREAWSSGKVVDIDLKQSVNQWYFDNVLNPRIGAWLDEQSSANADSGTWSQRAAERGRNVVIAEQMRAVARGQGQLGADILGVAVGINVGLLDVGTGTGRASIQFQNGEIDGLEYSTAIVNDIGTTASAPLMFMPVGAGRQMVNTGRGGFGVFGPLTEGVYLPRNAAELAQLQAVHARAATMARSPAFLRTSGLSNNASAQEAFFGLLENATPALSRTGGAAGFLRGLGGRTQMSLALAPNSFNFAIRHELHHFAREAIYRTKHGQSLFLQELNGSLTTRIGLLFREESIVWWLTGRR